MFLAKGLPVERTKIRHKPVLQQNGAYDSRAKCKVNMAMPRQLRAWSKDNEQVDLPADWKTRSVVATVTVKALYVVSNMSGPVLEATDVMLCSSEAMDVCPF